MKDRPEAPIAGEQAATAASPTSTDPLGVDPICTRDPQCPLHDRSLDTLVGRGRPLAVLFATPARCQSQYCAPVLDALLPLVDAYRDRVDIVHVEIYKDLRSSDLVPTVEAWNLPGEPFLFGVDAGGTITARLDGAMGTDEMRTLLESLAANRPVACRGHAHVRSSSADLRRRADHHRNRRVPGCVRSRRAGEHDDRGAGAERAASPRSSTRPRASTTLTAPGDRRSRVMRFPSSRRSLRARRLHLPLGSHGSRPTGARSPLPQPTSGCARLLR